MKQTKHLLAITILWIGALLIMTGRVNATPYSFIVDRFEVVGNLPGNVVDEFDDGSLDPLWEIREPGGPTAVVEAGGVVTFSNPGSVEIEDGLLRREFSHIYSRPSSTLLVEDGAGDFHGTSTWAPIIPGQNQFYHMNLIRHFHFESIGIAVTNFMPGVADHFGVPAGPSVILAREFDVQGVPIMPGDIIGDIALRLAFDDDANLYTGAFSLDGGATFLSPFSAVTPTPGGPSLADWRLGAESWEVIPEPSAFLLLGSGLAGLAGFGRKRLFKKA